MSAAVSPSRPAPIFSLPVDWLLGCGGLSLLFLATMQSIGFDFAQGTGVARPVLLLIFSVPHYGATLLRVYERRADRRRYSLFAVWATLAVVALWGGSLLSGALAALVVTVYLTWSPWHYTGQNYGITTMLLRRASVEVTPLLRRLLHGSFTLSFVIVGVVMHGPIGKAADYADNSGFSVFGAFRPIGIPAAVADPVVALAGIALVSCLGAALVLLLRQASLSRLAGPLLLIATQSLWFTVPFSLAHFGLYTGWSIIDLDQRGQLFIFIAGSHAIQYLWITSYFARSSSGWSGIGPYWLKAMLLGQLVWTLPTVLVGVTGVVDLPYDGGLFMITAAAVNLHHFILDGAIWKLRSSRVASVLLRGEAEGEAPPIGTPSAWPRRVVWGVASVALAIALFQTVAGWVFVAAVRAQNPELGQRVMVSLEQLGIDRTRPRMQLARLYLRTGNGDAALAEAQVALGLAEAPETLELLGEVRAARGEWVQALDAYEHALEMRDQPRLLRSAGLAALEAGEPARAREYLGRLVRNGRADREVLRAYARAGRELRPEEGLKPAARPAS